MLENLLFIGNPLREKYSDETEWKAEVVKRLKSLKKLDGNFFLNKQFLKINLIQRCCNSKR